MDKGMFIHLEIIMKEKRYMQVDLKNIIKKNLTLTNINRLACTRAVAYAPFGWKELNEGKKQMIYVLL